VKITKLVLFCMLVLAVAIPLNLVVAAGSPNPPPTEDTAGNNLSFPVIWAEGMPKTLPGTAGMAPLLTGEKWYQWGTNGVDPNITPASCPIDPDEESSILNPGGLHLCDDGIADSVDVGKLAGEPPADNPLPLAKVFLQKDPGNLWQAWSGTPGDAGVAQENGEIYVDWIDWGDNLESVDWYTRSQVRTEVVLFQDLLIPQLEYEMRHTSGWGINEVHGLAASLSEIPIVGPGTQATVYSPCARLTIQLLLVERGDGNLADLIWEPGLGWTEPQYIPGTEEPYTNDLINPPIFNGVVYEAGDGPGYYNAEINVKGRIIYGYTWNVRQKHDDALSPSGAGDYRLTFSFDQTCGAVDLKTYFEEGITEIMVPLETEEAVDGALATAEASEEPVAGAEAVLDTEHNLTYIDVRILERISGGKGGKSPDNHIRPPHK
jgi:hypothetical protein